MEKFADNVLQLTHDLTHSSLGLLREGVLWAADLTSSALPSYRARTIRGTAASQGQAMHLFLNKSKKMLCLRFLRHFFLLMLNMFSIFFSEISLKAVKILEKYYENQIQMIIIMQSKMATLSECTFTGKHRVKDCMTVQANYCLLGSERFDIFLLERVWNDLISLEAMHELILRYYPHFEKNWTINSLIFFASCMFHHSI